MKKGTFDVIFIAVAAAILLLIHNLGYMEKYAAFSLIPILIAYYLGQFSQRKFGGISKNDSALTNNLPSKL